MRLSTIFATLAMLVLFSNFSCPDTCEELFALNAMLPAEIENRSNNYTVGETIWLRADFAAERSTGANGATVGENGGLAVTHVFTLAGDSTTLLPAGDAITFVEDNGQLLERRAEDDPAAVILRFTCPDGRCGFRQGIRINQAGAYFLLVNGSTFELANGTNESCSPPTFRSTELGGASNLEDFDFNYPLIYPEARSFRAGEIDVFNKNVFLINAE